MKRANISHLRNRLSEFLDHVRAGGHVLILDRDRPIAEIVPIRGTKKGAGTVDEERLAALQREGILKLPSHDMPKLLSQDRPPGKGGRVLAALLEERSTGR